MFGYVKTDMPNMFVKDTVLYRAAYCGLCKGIAKVCGTKGRLVLNYDLTFLSILVHNINGVDVKVEGERCILHHIKQRPVAVPDEITKKIGALNVILAYHKLSDDIADENKGRIKRSFFSSSYKKSAKREPILDKIVKGEYSKLLEYEKNSCDSIDMISDPFGNMMQKIFRELLGENSTENTDILSYNFGKWIYLIDALDDFDKDKKKGNFNIFNNVYKDVSCKDALIKKYGTEIGEIFSSLLYDIKDSASKIKYKFNHDLIDNVLNLGLKNQTKMIMENIKCKNTTKF